jgi:hypothetical protein
MSGGGGGGSGYIGGVTDGITAQPTETDFIPNPITTGDGFVRITTISGGSGDVYAGNNLAIYNLLAPVNDLAAICAPGEVPVEIELINLGKDDYDFSKNNVTIGYEIFDPRQSVHTGSITIHTDSLYSGETKNVELLSDLPLYAGTYTIKAWVTSPLDNLVCDDTLTISYTSTKIGLPVREDFSNGIPVEFVSSSTYGVGTWEAWSDATAVVQPDSGSAMIRFNGAWGARSRLSTGQIDLYQTSNPYIEFYYYHDTVASVNDYSNIKLNVVVNGVDTTLATIYLRDPQGKHGWTAYRYYLNRFTTIANACILIQIEAINRYSGTAQYIDYIEINAESDVTVSNILFSPELTACNRFNRDILVEVRTTTTQTFTFNNAAELILEIDGVPQSPVSLAGVTLQGGIPQRISVLPNFTVPIGTTSMKAYFGSPVDDISANDTARRLIVLNPKLEVVVHNISTLLSKTSEGFENPQKITLKNTGNIELSNIGLILTVNAPAAPYSFASKKVYMQTLAAGDTVDITFDEAYTVPWAAQYEVNVLAFLACDSAHVYASGNVQEHVDMNDLYIIEVTNPVDGTKDDAGDTVRVSLRIKNRNIAKDYLLGEANIGIMIKNDNGSLLSTVALEELPFIEGGGEISYTFKEVYTVPSLVSRYHLIVYLKNVDNYPKNDTASIPRETTTVSTLDRDGLSFSMEQNVPNPAKENTIINYSVPQDGEIVFQMYSVSGQLLYTKEENVSFGEHQIELNLSDYAAGIYFYSMEYKGQRLVKRMNIKR